MTKLQRFTAGAALPLRLGVSAFGQHYTQTNLGFNISGVAPVTDPQLVNPWGLSRGSNGAWWVSDNLAGVSTLYNGAGVKNPLIVTIPRQTRPIRRLRLEVQQVRSSTAARPIS